MTKKKLQQKLGIFDFIDYAYECNPEYALIAVKAPLEITIQSFIKPSKAQAKKENTDKLKSNQRRMKILSGKIIWEKNLALESEDEYYYLFKAIPVLQIYNSEWTIIMRSLFGTNLQKSDDIPREARQLSERLTTKTIIFVGSDKAESAEDYNHSISYNLFENGELLERFEKDDENEVYFESTLREKPDLDFNRYEPASYEIEKEPRFQFVNSFFSELGIYLPACYPGSRDEDDKVGLAVKQASENTIERADWLIRKQV